MNNKFTKSFNKDDTERKWALIDLKDQPVGRAASKISNLLVGKTKATYSRNADTGYFVVAINASQLKFTGKKLTGKVYYHHTGFPGGIKEVVAQDLLRKKPTEVLRHAVHGMLPKNFLNPKFLKKLKIYANDVHPHQAQKLETIKL